jgi:hypothetical protein
MAWNDVRADGQVLYDHEWNAVINEISTGRVSGQSTDFVTGSSTQFAPALINKTVTIYSANAWTATTTWAVLNLEQTTENDVIFSYIDFSTLGTDPAQFETVFDQGWDSSNLYARFNWTAQTAEAGTVIWNLKGRCYGDGSTFNTGLAELITSTDTFAGESTSYVFHRSAETTNFLVPGTGYHAIFQVNKLVTGTMSTNARLLSVELRGMYASTY